MGASIVSSIIFFLLFIILSVSVDRKAFAAQMEHRKLNGEKETMTMRRNLQDGNGGKIAAHRSWSGPAGGKASSPNVPSKTPSVKVTPRRLDPTKFMQRKPCNSNIYGNRIGCAPKSKPCTYYNNCKRGTQNSANNFRS